jgi:wobble nucleotide-excising tRNase
MITKITRIKNFGLYKDFKWPKDLEPFRKYNLIYGWNYSGKTTLSRIFRCIELKQKHKDFENGEFELETDREETITDKALETFYQVRVFNTDYIKENISWDSQEANPLFLIGKEEIQLHNKLKKLEEEKEKLETDKKIKQKEVKRENDRLGNLLTEKARQLNEIKPPYDKRHLKNALKEVEEKTEDYIISKKKISECKEVIKTTEKEELSTISFSSFPQEINSEIEDLLSNTPVSRTIIRLKKDPELNNWVREGFKLHKGKERCEFCGGIIKPEVFEKYEKHFSEDYEKLTSELKNKIKEINSYKVTINLVDEKRTYPQLEVEYKKTKDSLKNKIKTYNDSIEGLVILINKKLNNPFKNLAKEISFPDMTLKDSIRKLNEIIKKHNEINKELETEKEKSFRKLELHHASEFAKDHKYFEVKEKINKLNKEIDNIEKEFEDKDKVEKKIKGQLSGIKRAAEELNNYLFKMFNRSKIKIEPAKEKKFKIFRDNKEAKNLSSGEQTAIAFSHFLTRIKDDSTDISKSIIFIDDPISSLDYNHMYNTYALIRAESSGCKQLIISSHSQNFFNLIKYWLKDEKKKDCYFYLNERIIQDNDEVSTINKLPFTLLKYKSEYQYLFSKIKTFYDKNHTDYDSLYQLPNILRRFLEAFLGFKYSSGLKGLSKIIENKSDCLRVEKLLHNYSHQNNLNRSISFCDPAECRTVIDIILRAIEKNDKEHFDTLENNFISDNSESK